MKDLLDRHAALVEDVRKLETQAHRTPVENGGFGYNSPWIAVHPVAGNFLPNSKIYACARSDVVFFKTVGDGLAVDPITDVDNPQPAFTISTLLAPTARCRCRVQTLAGGVNILDVRSTGIVFLDTYESTITPNGRGYPIG